MYILQDDHFAFCELCLTRGAWYSWELRNASCFWPCLFCGWVHPRNEFRWKCEAFRNRTQDRCTLPPQFKMFLQIISFELRGIPELHDCIVLYHTDCFELCGILKTPHSNYGGLHCIWAPKSMVRTSKRETHTECGCRIASLTQRLECSCSRLVQLYNLLHLSPMCSDVWDMFQTQAQLQEHYAS